MTPEDGEVDGRGLTHPQGGIPGGEAGAEAGEGARAGTGIDQSEASIQVT